MQHQTPYKRHVHHMLVRLRHVHYAYLFAAFIASGTCFAFAYRNNNVTALQLRDDLLLVDKSNGDVEAALKKLREFTYSHMNAGLSSENGVYPPIQLVYRYERLQAEAKASAKPAPRNDQQIAADAAVNCGVAIGVRNACVQAYQEQQVTKQQATITIPDALYKFDFVAPIWSPDLAGWSFVGAVLLALTIVIRFAAERWLAMLIKSRA